jgi:hypothetical protein
MAKPHVRIAVLILLAGMSMNPVTAASRGLNLSELCDWDLVVDRDAVPSEHYAAEEFQQFFKQATGMELPIRHTAEGDGHVYIGPGAALEKSPLGFVMDRTYADDELRIVITADNVAVTGGRPRGVLYGVYQFLEDELGVRFLTAKVTHAPPVPEGTVLEATDRFYNPPLSYRFFLKSEVIDHVDFAVRRRQNGIQPLQIPEHMGGSAPKQFFLHNNMGLHEAGFDQHPEYYTFSGGKRRSSQICQSHPDVRRLVWSDIEKHAPDMRQDHVIALAQNDAGYPCDCPQCSDIRREGESPEVVAQIYSEKACLERFGQPKPLGMMERPVAGPHSVATVDYVNHLAEKLEALRPDLRIGTMAYSYTMMPPRKTRVRDNVIIQFATYHACVLHQYGDPSCRINRVTAEYLQGWSEVCDNLVMWFYDHNHQDVLSVVPNLHLQAGAIQLFVENNAKGIFTQSTPRNNGFSDLRTYLLTSLHWNPYQDSDALIDEFLAMYYGEAPAKLIRQWLDLVHDGVDRSQHTNIGYQARHIGLDPALGETGLRLFEEAMAKAETPEIRDRIEKVSITAWRLVCEPLFWNACWARMTADAREVPLADVSFPLTDAERMEQREHYRRLLALCNKYEINQYREGILIDHASEQIRNYLGLGEGEEI